MPPFRTRVREAPRQRERRGASEGKRDHDRQDRIGPGEDGRERGGLHQEVDADGGRPERADRRFAHHL